MRFDDPLALVGYFLLACFWAVISWLVLFAICTARSRRPIAALLGGAVVAGLLWGGLYVGATPGSAAFLRYHFWTRELFGRKFYLPSPRFSYTDPGFVDLYSIKVFDLTNALAQWASAPPPEFTTSYPDAEPSQYRKRVTWHPTPVEFEYARLCRYLETAESGDASRWRDVAKDEAAVGEEEAEDEKTPESKGILEAENLRKQLMKEPGNYFAFSYMAEEDGSFDRVTCHVLSPKRRVLITVTQP